jgi:dTDP-4-amino-4,6-dideoxygalactose transaminase
MIVTPNKELASWCRRIRQHGRKESVGHAENPLSGFNFWLSDLNAAIVREQLKRIKYLNESRQEIAHRYCEWLKGFDLYYGDHLMIFKMWNGVERECLENLFNKRQIGFSRPYIPLTSKYKATNAWNLYERSLSIPYYPGLKKIEQRYIIETIKEAIG